MVNTVIGERKKRKKKMVLDGYFGESAVCDGCNTHQEIYSETVYLENRKMGKYCFTCSIKEKEKEINEIKQSYYQVEGKPEPEIVLCSSCKIQETKEMEKFRKHAGEYYCMDCFVRVGKVVKDIREQKSKNYH